MTFPININLVKLTCTQLPFIKFVITALYVYCILEISLVHLSDSPPSVCVCNLLKSSSTPLSSPTGKQLRVYSITAGKKKVLSENCAGRFSTAPADIKLHFYEITTHVQDVFPYEAVLALPEGSYGDVLNDLHCSTVTLKKEMNESSVIATRCAPLHVCVHKHVWVHDVCFCLYKA